MKNITLCIATLLIATQVHAVTLDDIKTPKPPRNQLGVNMSPENSFELIKNETTSIEKNNVKLIQDKTNIQNYTYADLSLKRLASELSQDLQLDTENITQDIKILWVGAATRSETISYAMYKLSNPDEEKPNDTLVKKIIRPVANMTSFAGIGIADPFVATSAMVGGNLMRAVVSDNKEINYKYSKVTDADMVILVRKIDDLQQDLTDRYCDYMAAREILKIAIDITKKRKDRADSMANRSKNEVLIADAYYRDSLNYENKKRAEFMSKRAALEQIVGNEALHQFEKTLTEQNR